MLNGAPDLALTQFAVETLLIVILMTPSCCACLARRHSRDRRANGGATACSPSALPGVMFVALASMACLPIDLRLSDYFGQTSYLEAYGRNVVNVILVDYRAIDTLGEIAVVAFATIAAWGLLRGARLAHEQEGKPCPLSFQPCRALFFVLMLVVSVFMLFRGHNEPGGGFVGGLFARWPSRSLALADGVDGAHGACAIHPIVLMGVGLFLAFSQRPARAAVGRSFLTHWWAELGCAPSGHRHRLRHRRLFRRHGRRALPGLPAL